jgi:UTP--glucose-1-phosphate uridylyltransferase
MDEINKALVIAAGLGARFLPASKAIPKVMFPVVDKPIIQIVVEEAVKGGIGEVIFIVSSYNQEIIKNHFSELSYLNSKLKETGKERELEEIKRIGGMAKFSYVQQQPGRMGTGITILSAEKELGGEPFVMMFSDDFILATPPFVSQLKEKYGKYHSCILGCMSPTNADAGVRFGFVVGEKVDETTIRVREIIEKPGVGKEPSDMAVGSAMILTPNIIGYLKTAEKSLPEGRELYYVDGIKAMIEEGLPVYAMKAKNSRYFDTGDKLGYIKAQVEMGLENEKVSKDLKSFLESLV